MSPNSGDDTNPPMLKSDSSLPEISGATTPQTKGGNLSALIPYKNPRALIAYYLSYFALLPGLGLLFSVPALALGIMGLRACKRNPELKGSVHAWIGIVVGAGLTITWSGIAIRLIFAVMVPPYPN